MAQEIAALLCHAARVLLAVPSASNERRGGSQLHGDQKSTANLCGHLSRLLRHQVSRARAYQQLTSSCASGCASGCASRSGPAGRGRRRPRARRHARGRGPRPGPGHHHGHGRAPCRGCGPSRGRGPGCHAAAATCVGHEAGTEGSAAQDAAGRAQPGGTRQASAGGRGAAQTPVQARRGRPRPGVWSGALSLCPAQPHASPAGHRVSPTAPAGRRTSQPGSTSSWCDVGAHMATTSRGSPLQQQGLPKKRPPKRRRCPRAKRPARVQRAAPHGSTSVCERTASARDCQGPRAGGGREQLPQGVKHPPAARPAAVVAPAAVVPAVLLQAHVVPAVVAPAARCSREQRESVAPGLTLAIHVHETSSALTGS